MVSQAVWSQISHLSIKKKMPFGEVLNTLRRKASAEGITLSSVDFSFWLDCDVKSAVHNWEDLLATFSYKGCNLSLVVRSLSEGEILLPRRDYILVTSFLKVVDQQGKVVHHFNTVGFEVCTKFTQCTGLHRFEVRDVAGTFSKEVTAKSLQDAVYNAVSFRTKCAVNALKKVPSDAADPTSRTYLAFKDAVSKTGFFVTAKKLERGGARYTYYVDVSSEIDRFYGKGV